MAEDQSILSHVSVGTNDFARAAAFYDTVLGTLGCRRIMEHPDTIAWGKSFPEFWVHVPIDGQRASVGNGTHIGFTAATRQEVHDFYAAALEAGATADGPPGPRPHYGRPITAASCAISTGTRSRRPIGIWRRLANWA